MWRCLSGRRWVPRPEPSRGYFVYDPAGKAGDYYRVLSDYKLEASNWGVELEIKAYTDEETAAKDYEAGQCDGGLSHGRTLATI